MLGIHQMRLTRLITVWFIMILGMTAGCQPTAVVPAISTKNVGSPELTQTLALSPTPAATMPLVTPTILRQQQVSTPTQLPLPFDDTDIDHEHCQSPAVLLSLSDAQGLNEDEIAGKLMDLWLSYFSVPNISGYCRIDGYHIDKVFYDERTPYLPLEPKGDFMRVVQFSIKLVQEPSFWDSNSGERDPQNWLHTGNNMAIFHGNTGYTMQFAYP